MINVYEVLLYFGPVAGYMNIVNPIFIHKQSRYVQLSLKCCLCVSSRTQNHFGLVAYKQCIPHRNASKVIETLVLTR